MSAVPKQFTNNQNKTKARYLVALKGVLEWEQIRQSVALFDDLCAAGVEDITPEHFGAVIASTLPGAAGRESEIIAALRSDTPGSGGPAAVSASKPHAVDTPSSSRAAGASSREAPTEVFTAVMNSILQQLDDHAGSKVDVILRKLPHTLASSGGVSQFESAFQHWTDTLQSKGMGEMVSDLPASSINTLMDALYGLVCDTCGPQITDKVFDRAVSAVEKLPVARKYSPRQLL